MCFTLFVTLKNQKDIVFFVFWEEKGEGEWCAGKKRRKSVLLAVEVRQKKGCEQREKDV